MANVFNKSRFVFSMAMAAVVTADGVAAAEPPSITIAPGEVGEVDDKTWNKIKDRLSVKRWLDAGLLSESRNSASPMPANADAQSTDLRQYSDEEVISLIDTMDDIEELRQLASLDTRRTVRAAVQKRVQQLGG